MVPFGDAEITSGVRLDQVVSAVTSRLEPSRMNSTAENRAELPGGTVRGPVISILVGVTLGGGGCPIPGLVGDLPHARMSAASASDVAAAAASETFRMTASGLCVVRKIRYARVSVLGIP
jgi:hypothetical protein